MTLHSETFLFQNKLTPQVASYTMEDARVCKVCVSWIVAILLLHVNLSSIIAVSR